MLEGIHILLTYACNFECDHCFLYCTPRSEGTFTLQQLKTLFVDAEKIKSLKWVYFEGGEPFLYYPLLVEGVRMTRALRLKAGVVTNGYWATAAEDAVLWLISLSEADLADLSVSDDLFHYEDDLNLAKRAVEAAEMVGIPVSTISIEKPTLEVDKDQEKGEPVVGGGCMFRGRAVEKLTEGLPRRLWHQFNQCPYEDLEDPKRVHVDSFGNVHICQGISMGNMWETPLHQLLEEYDPYTHPVVGPLVRGGPAQLLREYQIDHEDSYVDACHCCYSGRMKLLDQFPQYLTPRQVYGEGLS
ncbi:MAG: 4Fe-4S cluster-binding domain-containing protein [Theionarchaea archaeon]|nr:4Fe-4S cluster-binding domain-containing protein [Theionarchaea archaeon]MBU7019955.1 4Fe-4S cluster-binding domain-containing protein [Theionarchaea archaeon]MBU7034047.1 4Fe-4S cluster-binding domain-containing protein [Theionarchaea archaeon]MBU7039582.1 4Fe-4S cluster-binding domain-containing protein [Theionarchaea archaeon]